jgi:hypothetical protein
MSTLQTRSAAPGKARRAAKGKPRHTTAQKAVARKTSDVPKSPARGTTKPPVATTTKPKSAPTRRDTDIDPTTVTKKEARNQERSKLRATRFQQAIAPKAKPETSERAERTERPSKFERPAKSDRSAPPTKSVSTRPPKRDDKPTTRADKFVKDLETRTTREYSRPVESDRRPTTRREAVKAKESYSTDGRPNFVPQKREKFIPGSKPRTTQKPARDRRNDSPAYARDDRRASKTHSNIAVDFGADDN